MNLILLFKEDFTEGTRHVRLRGRRLEHVMRIHRAVPGDKLSVGLVNDRIGTGTVTGIDAEQLEMDIVFLQPPPKRLPLNLILALPRPKALNRIIVGAVSMGVKNIWLINAYRVEKSYWQSPRLSEENLIHQSVLGLEQSKDTVLPSIILKPLFKPFAEDELGTIIKGTTPLAAHPDAVNECPKGVSGPVTLAIGPEGGFIPYEIEQLKECGFTPVHLGERILRIESAVPALLGRLF
jgi:RsmE family RNA methyltransferase